MHKLDSVTIRQFYLLIKSVDRVMMKYKIGNLYYEHYK